MSRTNSPISDPEPNYAMPDEKPGVLTDPLDDEKVALRQDKKYGKLLEAWDNRLKSLKPPAEKPEGMSYEEYGIKSEVYNRVSQELEMFKGDIELTYGLRKQQG